MNRTKLGEDVERLTKKCESLATQGELSLQDVNNLISQQQDEEQSYNTKIEVGSNY